MERILPAARGVSGGKCVHSHQDSFCSSPNNIDRSIKARSVSFDFAADSLEGSTFKCVRFWEFNVMGRELQNLWTLDLTILQSACSDDLNRVSGGAMSTSHLHVHLRDSSAEGAISVLFVHVNGTSAGEVTKDNAVVSEDASLFLEDLGCVDDFTLNLANLMLSLHEIPELGSGEDLISGEHAHSVESRIGRSIGWESSSNNVELSQLNIIDISMLDTFLGDMCD